MSKYKIFIGWDSREKIAYEVLQHSIEKYSCKNQLDIIPLYHKELRNQGFFKRPWLTNADNGNYTDLIDGKPFSTEFSHSRFLIPAIMNFNGWALFMDCDMLFTDDIRDVFKHCDDKYAVMCVKHQQEPIKSIKMDGSPQEKYYRKNWSSFMLVNCGHPANKKLTREVVNTSTGRYLHTFEWLGKNSDALIGSLPADYNWIVDSPVSKAKGGKPKMIHYTYGGCWFKGYQDVPFAQEWWDAYKDYLDSNGGFPDPSDAVLAVDYKSVAYED